jgi:hypothetical protein
MNYKVVICLLVISLCISISYAQLSSGDYRSIASGNWNAASTWEVYDGSTWSAASVAPTATNNVFIQIGHTVTLTQAEACNDININTGSAAKIALVSYTLSQNGKLRLYTGAINALPGTDTNGTTTMPLTCTTATGILKVVGGSRSLTTALQWGSGSFTGSSSLFNMEINATPGATITMRSNIKAQSWNIVSGILDVGNISVEADRGTAAAGNVTVGVSATVINSNVGTNSIFRRSNGLRGGTLTMNGLLKIMTLASSGVPRIAMSVLNMNGTVEYAASGNQYTLGTGGDSSTPPTTFNNVILSGTGTKTLSLNTTVNGTLTRVNTSSLALSTYTLTYGASATLEYQGTAAVTTADPEFPASGGPANLMLNNSGNVTLHANRAVTGLLTFSSGSIAVANYSLTVNNPVAGISSYIYNGSGYITGAGLGTESNVILQVNTATIIPALLNNLTVQAGISNIANLPDNTAINNLIFVNGSLGFNTKLLTFRNKDFAITGPNTISALTVSLTNTVNTTPHGISIAHTWTTTGTFPSTVDIWLFYPDAEPHSSQMRAWKRDSGALGSWSYEGTHTSTNVAGMRHVIVPGVTSLNGSVSGTLDWTLSEIDQLLPVELTSFTGQLIDNSYVFLSWVTQSESDLIGYLVYRSNENNMNTAVCISPSMIPATNTSQTHTYSFTDPEIQEGPESYYYWIQHQEYSGTNVMHGPIMIVVGDGPDQPPVVIPPITSIKSIYPNPFHVDANISYGLSKGEKVSLIIYNVRGQRVRSLVSTYQDAGTYNVIWDGRDMNGRICAAGLYYTKLNTNTYHLIKKFVYLK